MTIATPLIAPEAFTSCRQHLLGVELDVAVDRQLQPWPGTGSFSRCVPDGMARPCGSSSTTSVPFLPLRLALYALSRPARPLPSRPTMPEHVRGQIACRVEPLRLRQHADAGQVELGDLLADRGIDVVGQVAEGGVGQQSRDQLATDLCSTGASLMRLAGDVGHLGRLHVDVVRVDVDGEHVARAVEDLAAGGRLDDGVGALLLGHLRVGVGLESLQLYEPAGQQQEERRHGGSGDPEPAPEGLAADNPDGRPGRPTVRSH